MNMKKINNKKITKANIKKTAILIPAHNEERVIEATIMSALGIVEARDLYVVDDFSKDNTAKIAKKYTRNVLSLNPNKGKAEALNTAIKHFKLFKKYDYILPMDADTSMDPNFVKETTKLFEGKENTDVIAVCGKVTGRSTNWITTFRLWEYEIAQVIHKNAQSKIRAISVCPGCSTLYKASLFEKVSFPTGTLTEDMDLTFLIHRQELGRIRYADKARVYTQDPRTIKDLLKQLDRWYTGFWQCVMKHDFPWRGQMVDFEVALLATEALLGGILLLVSLVSMPFLLLVNYQLVIIPILVDLVLLILPTILWTTFRFRIWKLPFLIPGFYLLRILANFVFLKSFFKTVLGIDFTVGWNKVMRYKVKSNKAKVKVKEKKWAISV
jgi:poly-beta-1,6-N-acetyl-D-glucosamine synthase